MKPLTAEEFWALTTPIPETGCWIFTNSSERSPYGASRVIGVDESGAHRIALTLHLGRLLPKGQKWAVMHLCDVKGCVNPAHLRLGTQRQNVIDMHARVGSKTRAASMRKWWADQTNRNFLARRRADAGGQP